MPRAKLHRKAKTRSQSQSKECWFWERTGLALALDIINSEPKKMRKKETQMLTVKRHLTTKPSKVLCNDCYWQALSYQIGRKIYDIGLGILSCSLILSRALEPLSLSRPWTSTTSWRTFSLCRLYWIRGAPTVVEVYIHGIYPVVSGLPKL